MSGRSLFIWFRVASEHEPALVEAVRALQATWAAECEGLGCELQRRCDEPDGQVTLMEVYRHPRGVAFEWQQRIEREAATRLAPWIQGPRHVEAFEPCA